jgi:hypothetical protein
MHYAVNLVLKLEIRSINMDELPFIETLEAEIADLESLPVQKMAELAQLKAEPRIEAPMLHSPGG